MYLFDPNLGNIEMSLEKFNELYIGVAMIFNEAAPAGAVNLTRAEMEEIKANGYIKIPHIKIIPGYWYYTYHRVSYTVSVPYVYSVWVPGYKLWGVIPIPGHYEPRIGWRKVTLGYTIRIPHYVPPKIRVYYTYIRTPDIPVIRIPGLSSPKTSSKTVVVNAAGLVSNKTFAERLADGEDMNGPDVGNRPTGLIYFSDMTPGQQAKARKQQQLAENLLKGIFLTSVGVGMVVGPIFVPFLAPIAPFTTVGGPIVINSGVRLMADGTDYI